MHDALVVCLVVKLEKKKEKKKLTQIVCVCIYKLNVKTAFIFKTNCGFECQSGS